MDNTVAELRAIVQRRSALALEDDRLHQRMLELLELNQGAGKSPRKRLSLESGKALFADLKRASCERSKKQ